MAKPKATAKTTTPDDEAKPFSGDPRHVSICFNRNCADYRRERPAKEPCACRTNPVRAAKLSIDIAQ
jgi:hypothetical protein